MEMLQFARGVMQLDLEGQSVSNDVVERGPSQLKCASLYNRIQKASERYRGSSCC